MPTAKLTHDILTAAIDGLESQKTRINQQIAELRAMLKGGSAHVAVEPEAPARKRRKFSTAAIQRMKAAQRARWAKIRGESEQAPTPEPNKPKKRRISAEGLKRIIAATKKRWALKRAADAAAKAKKAAPAHKKVASKKTAAPAKKAAKKSTVKKAAATNKKTAPSPAPTVAEPVAQ